MKNKFIALSFAVSTFCFAGAPHGHYVNGRFFFAVDYPADVFFPLWESENGDGQVFASKEGDAELTVYGGWRGKELPFACDALDTATIFAKTTITYKWKKGPYSVASGFAPGGKIFYVKNILSKGRCVSLVLVYPTAKREVFDQFVSPISNSLKDLQPG